MKRSIKAAVLLLFIGVMFLFPQERCFAEAKAKLHVGVFESTPFAFKDELGNWHGISVDLWTRLAKDLNLEYTLVELTELQALTELSGGKIDIIVGGLAVTPEIEKIIDFTQPYYASDLAIGVVREKTVSLAGSLLELFFSWRFLLILGGLLTLLLIIGTIFWLIEKDSDREGFGDTWFSAIVYGLYWAGAMMTGAGEKGPRTIHGRLVALVWIFLGLFITSTFTASVATMLTTKHYTQKISGERDLPRAYVGAVQGTCENMLRKIGVRVLTCEDESTCFEKLMKGEIDAFVGAEPVMKHYAANKYRGKLDMIMMDYQEVFFSFGVNKNNELLEDINRAILRITASSEWADTLRRYLDY